MTTGALSTSGFVGNRAPTGRPPVGHAFRAEQARQALGVTRRPDPAGVPTSRFHVLSGMAIALAAVALREQSTGLRASVVLDGALGLITVAALVRHERTVMGAAGIRGRLEPGILPLAALLSLCLVLDGDGDRLAGAIAVALAAATIVVVPHLDAQRRLRRGGRVRQFVRQLLGIVVVAPMLVAAATESLPTAARIGVVAAGVTAAGIDTLHAEGTIGWRAILAAGLAAAIVAALALLPGAASPEIRAGALLIVWYGARSLAATVVNGRFCRVTLAEYSIVAIAAGMALQWTSAR